MESPSSSSPFIFPPYYYNQDDRLKAMHLITSRRGTTRLNKKGKITHGPPEGIGSPTRHKRVWKPLYKSIDKMYDVGSPPVKNPVLPIGTTVYRSSLEPNPNYVRPGSKLMYFGLDIPISLWVLLESFQKKHGDNWSKTPYTDWIGYIGLYTVKKPIPYMYLKGVGTPGEYEQCNQTTPCVHVQTILHGNNFSLVQELGTEMTMKPETYPNYLKLQKVLKVDILQLACHQTSSMFEWQPTGAILL